MKKIILLLFVFAVQASLFAQEYFPEGTKWTEIRLDLMKYDSWYSKVGDEWVPNFETVEYYVKGKFIDWDMNYKKVYSNGPEWTDSLTYFVLESGHNVEMTIIADDYVLWPAEAYQFDWRVGQVLTFQTINGSNTTCCPPCECYNYGVIDEIKEGDFGGVRPLKYVDLDGKAPIDPDNPWVENTNGGRIIQGIGITEWNNGECLFGPVEPYIAYITHSLWDPSFANDYYYRSMLVHFERDGEVLYDLWPEKTTTSISATLNDKGQMTKDGWYDLQGRKINSSFFTLHSSLKRGIYIEGGKKKVK